jgi:hypothetical protein
VFEQGNPERAVQIDYQHAEERKSAQHINGGVALALRNGLPRVQVNPVKLAGSVTNVTGHEGEGTYYEPSTKGNL